MSQRSRATNALGQKAGGVQLPVYIQRECVVDNELVNVSKSRGDELIWHSEDDEFVVEFPFSPFDDDTFVVPAGGSACSGPVRENAPITRYHYNIKNVALAMSADPGVDIKH
jgi:hypothetical protein